MMGHPSASVRQAEKRALDGDNESQDSQQVLEAYMKYRGIGIVSVAFVQALADAQQLDSKSDRPPPAVRITGC